MLTVVCVSALTPLLGCVIGADLINPALIATLGLDPGRTLPQQGTIIVAFANDTASPAVFFAYEGVNASDLASDSRNFSVQVDPGKTGNEVVDCPVAIVGPGTLGPNFQVVPIAAEVTGTGGVVQVTYGGAPLVSPDDFACGAVIEIRLTQAGGQQAGYVLTVRVVPG